MNGLIGAILTLLAVALWGALHSKLATPRVKNWLSRRLGPSADRGYRLFYNLVAAATLLPVLAIPARIPGPTLWQILSPWVFITTAVQVVAILVILLVLLQTGASSFLGIRQLFSPQGTAARLMVSGFYRWVRHPLYTAALVLIWLTPVMTSSTLVLFLGFTLYIVVGSRYEERQLVADFGESYQEYRLKIPAFVPRPWRRF